MKVLMVGVDNKAAGGMWTVIENYLNNKEFCEGINLKYIPTATSSFLLKKLLFSAKGLIKVFLYLIFNKIDIVHVHMAEKGSVFREGIVVVFSKIMKRKVIIHMHGATFEEWYSNQKKIIKNLVRYIFNLCDMFLILGEFYRPFMKTIILDETKINVLYNAVYVPKYNKYNKNGNEIIFLGMLIERKGIDDLLNAIERIKNSLPNNIIFKLYGMDKNGNIEKKISESGLGNVVKYCGWMTYDMRDECFSKSIINVLPSYHEGLPMSILETMSYGIPNISTYVAGIPEVIRNNQDGILINPGEVDKLSRILLELIENVDLRESFSNNSYNHIKATFNVKKHIEKLEKFYNDLIGLKER